MKILVTGGAGFIGSHIVDEYIQAGHSVAIVDDLSTGRKENLHSKARFYQLDVGSTKLRDIFQKEKPELVNHQAAQAQVRQSLDNPYFDAATNILAGLNLLGNCRRFKVKKIIYANTGGALYGEAGERELPVKEDYPIQPQSPYGLSKFTLEKYLEIYQKLYGLNFISLRYSNVYGPRQDPNGEAGVIAIFAGLMLSGKSPTIFGDGKQTRDYVYVADIARANLLALRSASWRRAGQKINLATGRQTSVQEIFQLIAQETGFKGQPKYGPAIKGELRRAAQDISLAKKVLAWQPKISLPVGIKTTLEYILEKSHS